MIDEQLVENCKKGEEMAFEELIGRYHKPIFNYIYGFTQDKQLVEDIVQETFIKMVNGIDKYNHFSGAKFSTWLFSIARNTVLDELRKKKVNFISIDEGNGLELKSPGDIEESYIQKDEMQKVNQVIDCLPPEARSLVYLRYHMNFSYKEISSILSYPQEKVKWRLHDTLEKIRKIVRVKEVKINEA